MKPKCDCNCCRYEVYEYFCPKCLHNFNECQTTLTKEGLAPCPKCNPIVKKGVIFDIKEK